MPTNLHDEFPGAPIPTAAEVDILAALWRLGPATVREVHQELGKDLSYNTTLTQMRLMTDKGLLRRSERFRNHVYEPAVPREQMQQRIAGDLIQRVFGGSAKGLILGALGARRVDDDELAEIRRMIAGLDKKKRGAK
jgi:BlaI family transcriptional regulator, penicillinase repressor